MEIERLIDELEDILEVSWHLPMTGGKALINTNEIKRILEDIRLNLPSDMAQAKKIVETRAKIIEDTHTEAANIMKASEEKVRALINKNEIVKAAQASAQNIISEAQSQAKEIKNSANKYTENIMKNLEDAMAMNLSEIKKAHQALRNSTIEK